MNANLQPSRVDSPRWGATHRPAPHYLWLGLAASLFVHAMLMAWQDMPSAQPSTKTAMLEVALVNARSAQAPVSAQVVAQADVDGGGSAQSGVATSPLPRTGEAPNTIVLEALRRRQAELEAEQMKLLTQLHSRVQAAPEKSTAHPWPDGQAPGNAETDQESVVLNAQIAALSERIQAYNRAPRKQFVAPSAASAAHAAYVDAWRTRIEALGTQHYPQQARGRTYGSLQMTVYIRADGSLADAVIDRPAEHQVLNLAARRIVQLAAPYPAFPPALAATTDVLAITRTWNFVNDNPGYASAMISTPSTQRFGVIGNPVSHSRSPAIHARFAQQTGINLTYEKIEAPIDDFEELVDTFFAQSGRGLNVTVPFKARAYLLTSAALSARAAQAGAVNTLWHDGTCIHGCNTDGIGLLNDLTRLTAWSPQANVLIVGAGGAARGVLGPFLQATQGSIHVVNRTARRAHELIDTFGGPTRLTAGALAGARRAGGWDIVINATSSGLSDAAPDLPDGLYAPNAWGYDMMYGSAPTAFMRQAQADGAAHTADGLGMLVSQAAESFTIWHARRPEVLPVLMALRAELDLAL